VAPIVIRSSSVGVEQAHTVAAVAASKPLIATERFPDFPSVILSSAETATGWPLAIYRSMPGSAARRS